MFCLRIFLLLLETGRMKIGMILDNEFPPDPRVENEAMSLIESGHEVFLFTVQYFSNRPARENYNGIQLVRYSFPKLVYKLSALAYSFPFYHWILFLKMKQFIHETNIDVIHIHDIQIARAVFWANKSFGKKIVLDLHENRPEIMRFYSHVNSCLGKMLIWPKRWKGFEKKYIQKSDKVVVVTSEAALLYQKQYKVGPKKFIVVPNTVRKKFYTDYRIDQEIVNCYQDRFTLLYVGDTGLRRGTLLLLESLLLLKDKIPNIKLVLVGKSRSDSVLREFAHQNGLDDSVDFLGWQDFRLFPSFIQAAKIGLSPLVKNTHHDTTFANKLFQYIAFGKPVVVSNCKAQAELVDSEKCGLVFENNDTVDMAEKIFSLFSSPKMYEEMSENAIRAITQKYNWENTTKDLCAFYTKK